jgi:hypothetical protein
MEINTAPENTQTQQCRLLCTTIKNNMDKFIDEKTRAIIIAIENYRYEKISKVKYALNDANAFRELLISEFCINPTNIKTYFDKYASKTGLEDELKYEIRNLQEDEKFIFYYVGHGFYGDGTNKLTAWDTSDTNFAESTLSLRDILIDPLNNSKCTKSLIFLDTCSKHISDDILSREVISNINEKELELILKQSEFCGTYISCSPGEKSYSDDNLQHGIWTYHLLEALRGQDKSLLVENKYITDVALRDYLRRSVPQFISEKTDIRDSQTPYAKLMSSNSFVIHEVRNEEAEKVINDDFPLLDINYEKIKLLKKDNKSVKEASGFKGTHWVPEKVSLAILSFIRGVFEQEISDEIQSIYQNAKDLLNLRRRDVTKKITQEGGVIETTVFKYKLSVCQNSKYPSYAQFDRELTIHDFDQITSDFDNIFNFRLRNILLDCNVSIDDFEDTVEKFENLAESENGRLEDDDRNFTITLTSVDGLVLTLYMKEQKILLTTNRNYEMKDFLERAERLINSISKRTFTFKTK